jgi:tetratricopeptide (TPR) repeat protein
VTVLDFTRLVQQGNAAAQAGDLDGAWAFYKQARAAMPENPNGPMLMAATCALKGDTRSAIALYQEAIQLQPGSGKLRHALGRLLDQEGETALAARQYQELTRLAPDSPVGWYLLGEAQFRMGQAVPAIEALVEATRLAPDFAPAQNLLGVLYSQRQEPEKAIASFEAVLAHHPDDSAARLNLAGQLSLAGQPEAALREYERLEGAMGTHAVWHYGRGVALSELNRDEEAIAAFERALALRPNWAEARHNLAWLKGRRGESEAAEREYRALLTRNQRDFFAHLGLGMLAADRHDEARARAAAQQMEAILRDAVEATVER